MALGGLAGQPRGLDEHSFATRHRLVLTLLWAQVPLLAIAGLAVGASVLEVVAASLTLTGLSVLGTFPKTNSQAANSVAIGLLTAAGILVYLTGGLMMANLYFLPILVAISLYRDWRLLALGIVYVTVYQFGLFVTPARLPVVDVHPLWSVVAVSSAVLAGAIVLMAGWRIDARSAALERSDADLYRLGFASAPALALLKPSGELIESNRAMADLLGYDVEDMGERHIRSMVHDDDLSQLGAAWQEMGNSSDNTTTAWMRCLTSEGRSFWGEMSLSLVRRTTSTPAVVVLRLADLSRAHDTEMRLENIIAGKDAFVAAIGDELRVPLGSVIDLAQMEDDPTLREIGAHARAISTVVDDLVISARFGGDTMAVVSRFIDSADICREVLARVPGSGLVTQELRPISAWADPQLTKQIIRGLVGNAIRYSGGNIVLRTVSSGSDTVIQVIDDGPEIPVSDRHRIFSSDLRNGRPVTQPASVGLGLTVGRRLARLMDGDIAYRRTKHHRNVFELRLPSDRIRRSTGQVETEEPLDIPA